MPSLRSLFKSRGPQEKSQWDMYCERENVSSKESSEMEQRRRNLSRPGWEFMHNPAQRRAHPAQLRSSLCLQGHAPFFFFLNTVELYSYYLLLLCSLVKPKMGQLLELSAGSLARGQFHAVTQFLSMFRQPNYQNGPLRRALPPRDFGRPCTDVLGEMAL